MKASTVSDGLKYFISVSALANSLMLASEMMDKFDHDVLFQRGAISDTFFIALSTIFAYCSLKTFSSKQVPYRLVFFSSLTVVAFSLYDVYSFSNVPALALMGALFLAKPAIEDAERITALSQKIERNQAKKILEEEGNSALDYFKLWTDKSYYFSPSMKSMIAYKISGDTVLVLGDPVGPKSEIKQLIANFYSFCKDHEYTLCFFQTSNELMETYEELGFQKLKIGDEAIVDVKNFHLDGPKKKDFRNRIRKMEKLGFTTKYYEAGLPEHVVIRCKQISDEWLDEPGRKERGFSLGYFEEGYIKNTPIFAIEDENGVIVAFLNVVPSFKDHQLGIDLMCKSKEAPSGVMDYLFVKFILKIQEENYETLNIGLAPMSGFKTHEKASLQEKAVHGVFKRLNFLFNYIGLKVFKSKFADWWEPRYLIYKNAQELPQLAFSINDALERIA